ncbi:MAG TPA: hypothetical protein ENI78_01840 [Euryarchaeota archaeon]|nr:hypothetical protein [Euryarchaeota archaeon]
MVKKSHINDVFAIADGNVQERNRSYELTQTRRNNRSLQTNRKGFKPSIRRKRYRLQPNDLVEHKRLFCKVKGAYNYGKYVILVGKT